MKEALKNKIKQGYILWLISWVGTIILFVFVGEKVYQVPIIFVADIVFPIVTLLLISKLNIIKQEEKENLRKEKEELDKYKKNRGLY